MFTANDEVIQVPLNQMLEGTRAHIFHAWRYCESSKNTKKIVTGSLSTLQESILAGYLQNEDPDAVVDFLSAPHLSGCLPPV